MKYLILLTLLCPVALSAQGNADLQAFSQEFWAWRAMTQPAASDDIPRIERPENWAPDFSKLAIDGYKEQYLAFRQKLDSIPKAGLSRADSVDFLLLHSAVERVNWELNVLRLHTRNPDFYVHQTFGALYEYLLIHTPMTEARANHIIRILNSFPKTVQNAKENLTEAVAAFAEIALERAQDPRTRLLKSAEAIKSEISPEQASALDAAVKTAATAMEDYLKWLASEKPKMAAVKNIGEENYAYFLKNIALIPYSPQELLLMGELEWNRSVAFDVYERLRNHDLPTAELLPTAEAQAAQSRRDEEAIRIFLEEKNIMSVPDWLQHYLNKKTPPRLEPFTNMGVVDDLTSESRLDEDAVSYIPEPSPNLSFFRLASAQDPRPIIIHEGVPGHYYQMAISWAHENPIRRHYYDSGANEGIGFYVEELMVQFGLFDNDRPRTREIMYRFMRLRALRVDVDINLALGNYTIEEAGKYLSETVPMDYETALHEANFFTLTPGQAITYQIGKLQILKLIADAKIKQGEAFSLRDCHDFIMLNGNVPIALQRWEYLGLTDEIADLWPESRMTDK